MANIQQSRIGIIFALSSAVLFGLSTPVAKGLLSGTDPLVLAALLYLGSGAGLMLWRLVRRKVYSNEANRLAPSQISSLIAMVLFGGIAAPVLLLYGLSSSSASTVALLLNLETVLTALIASLAFKEHYHRRLLVGMLLVTAGAMAVTVGGNGETVLQFSWGNLAVVAACLAWALDNNVTRTLSLWDPARLATIKGLTAGSFNLLLAVLLGKSLPSFPFTLSALVIGAFAYGASLVLFILALRHLGTARTSAYFSCAPFLGSLVSILVFREPVGSAFAAGFLLMAVGVWMHLTERHHHEHAHEPIEHTHEHVHDDHHQHDHGPLDPPGQPHTHSHIHESIVHSHSHFPDIHHRHYH